tara:strand:- start:4547 stop:4825 length:279 start_codon:yes stop_codon:yes gene_type:complete
LDKKYKEHGVDNMTLNLNINKNKQLDWHDDFKGTLVVDNKNYWINVRQRSETWMTGTISPMEEKSSEQEPKKEIKEEQTDTVHEDLDDEIPF